MAERIRAHRERRGAGWETDRGAARSAGALERARRRRPAGAGRLPDALAQQPDGRRARRRGRDADADRTAARAAVPGGARLQRGRPRHRAGNAARPRLPRPRRPAQSGGSPRPPIALSSSPPAFPSRSRIRAAVKIPATIVTGFLGAGKTSLIRHLLANADGRRLAVDHQRVRRPRRRPRAAARLRRRGLRRGRHDRAAERLHLLHRRRRLPADDAEAARPAGAARPHRHRDLRPRAAEAAGQGVQLAGGARAGDGRRGDRGGRRAGGRGRPLRRRSGRRCEAERAADPALDHEQPLRGAVRGPARLRRPGRPQQDRPARRAPAGRRSAPRSRPAAAGDEGGAGGARRARSARRARHRRARPKARSTPAGRTTTRRRASTTTTSSSASSPSSGRSPIRRRWSGASAPSRRARHAARQGLPGRAGQGDAARRAGVGSRLERYFDRPWRPDEPRAQPAGGDRPARASIAAAITAAPSAEAGEAA